MKLSDQTVSVLKNYSTINQNLLIKCGNTLQTMSAMKNIVSKSIVTEDFKRDVAIYDLNEFLSSMSLFDKPEMDFKDDFVVMSNEGSNSKLKYWYSDPSVVTTVSKEIQMPECEVKFSLSSDILSNVQKAAAVIGAPDMVLENGNLRVTDKKNDTANAYSIDVVGAPDERDYKFWFKVENLKLLPGTYDVSISSKRISHFKNTNVDIEYFIALEPESYFNSDS
tara:strand:- start:208 stop:876 length:669 start_codon:yes stop_codon:yes gene_type:complete